jgi:hypothetical protein
MGYMEATESLKYPYLITRDTSPPRELWEFVFIALSDGLPRFSKLVRKVSARQPCPVFGLGFVALKDQMATRERGVNRSR